MSGGAGRRGNERAPAARRMLITDREEMRASSARPGYSLVSSPLNEDPLRPTPRTRARTILQRLGNHRLPSRDESFAHEPNLRAYR